MCVRRWLQFFGDGIRAAAGKLTFKLTLHDEVCGRSGERSVVEWSVRAGGSRHVPWFH